MYFGHPLWRLSERMLKTTEEVDRWMIAPAADVPKLQQPLPGGSLSTVATGVKEDGDEDGPAKTA